MKKMVWQGVTYWIGTLLIANALTPVAQALSPDYSTQPIQPVQTGNTCTTNRNEAAERAAYELSERVTQAISDRRLEDAAYNLSQALRSAQVLQNAQTKANMTETWIASGPGQPSLLDQIVKLAIEADRPDIALNILPAARQYTQSLSSAYSRIKTAGLVAIANDYQQLGQSGQATSVLADALRAASFIRGAEFTAPALTSIAQGYVAIGQASTALPLLDQALQAANTIQATNHRVPTLSQIAIAYATAGNLDRALQTAQGIQTTPYYGSNALRAVASQYLQKGDFNQAIQVVQRIPDVDLKAIALAEIAGAYAKAGQADQASQTFTLALQTARTVRNQGFRIMGEVVKQYAQSGQIDAARTAAQAIPDLPVKVQTLAAIALTYAEAGRAADATATLDQAIQQVKTVRDVNEQANLLSPIVEEYRVQGQYRLSFQAAQALSSDEFSGREGVYSSIVRSAIAADQLDLALEVNQAIGSNWSDYKNQGYQGIAIAYAKAGQFDRALQIANLADNFGSYSYQVRTLAAIAGEAQKRGQTTQAETILTQALEITNQFDTVNQKADGLVAIAIQYAIAGQTNRSAQLQQQMLTLASGIEDASTQGYVLREAISQYLNANQYVSAIQAAQAIRDMGERMNNLTSVVNQAIQAGQYARALQAVRSINVPESKTRFLVTIATRYLQTAQPNQASPILAEAFEVAKTISDPESKTIVVRVDYDANGNPIPSTTIDDDNDRGSLLEAIAIAYGQAGQYNRAVQVAQTIQDTNARNQLLQRIRC